MRKLVLEQHMQLAQGKDSEGGSWDSNPTLSSYRVPVPLTYLSLLDLLANGDQDDLRQVNFESISRGGN